MPTIAGSPGNRRKKLLIPLPRKNTWCMCCLRVSNRDWELKGDGIRHPFKVGCISDTAQSKSCAHCAKQHKVCESVPEGIEGNRFELLSLLAWSEHIWLTSEGEYGASLDQRDGDGDPVEFALPWDLIVAVSEAVRDLVAGFDNLVKNHKHLHHLTGTRVPLAVHDSYNQWVADRRSSLVRDTRTVVHDWDRLAVEASIRGRLVGSEESVHAWHGAVVSFKAVVEHAISAHVVDPVVSAALAMHLSYFPFAWEL
ncbi:hypothetical protein N7447_004979 [Penicillium robsamsonii]|uniref:uncharacterized protein n=1 Tax=Penicillium robsamsonii TaxID=1792511 RepID=UPI0025487562|nr:uncharacterized protein N7447_004979 [Penicillium robsamsonii]KAJ5822639.1 hypothetical protein N7447_004979 [Penicillium robsamsonii]